MTRLIVFSLFLIVTLFFSQPVSALQQTGSHGNRSLTELTYAYFPLAVPISVLAETMQRDLILQKNLAQRGFKLAFKPFAKGNDVQPLIRMGQIAAVSVSDLPAIEALSTADMLAVGFVKQSYAAIVAPHGTQTANLRNKRIGNAYGSTSHYALLQALESVGLSEKDITLVPLEVSQMLAALENGSIDAFAAWEPTPTVALKKHPDRFTQINRQVSFALFLVSGSLVRSNPDAAREITAALVRAINWLEKSSVNLLTASRWAQAGMQVFTGKPSQLADTEIARITRTDLLDIAGAPVIPRTMLDKNSLLFKEFDFLKQINKLPADASRQRLEQGFASRLLHDLLATPARYGLKRYDYAR